MKKILSLMLVLSLVFALSGCRKKKGVDVNFNEQTTESTLTQAPVEETTTQAPPQSSHTDTTKKNNSNNVSFDNVPTDNNNPIDKDTSKLFNEADTTSKINEASEAYYHAWKYEFDNIGILCRENGITGFSQQEHNSIAAHAQSSYDNTIAMGGGGTSSVGEAFFNAGSVYKKGTYYFAELYKRHSGNNYTYEYDE